LILPLNSPALPAGKPSGSPAFLGRGYLVERVVARFDDPAFSLLSRPSFFSSFARQQHRVLLQMVSG